MSFGQGKRPTGPYGTNPGDIWTGEGSEMQRRLDRDKPGFVIIHQVNRDGGDAVFITDDPETIAAARRGTEHYVAARAMEN